jgi:type I restriction enzyme S subunit
MNNIDLSVDKYSEQTYHYSNSCVFRKTKESFGGLSNMCAGFPIVVNGIKILTSEALYQVCRFPSLPEVQMKIINEKSPMGAKMAGKPFRIYTRENWNQVRVEIMYWCLKAKLAQNYISFGMVLESTFDKPIVEESHKDKFWGAVKNKNDESTLSGANVLGRCLMELRSEYNSENRYNLLYVEPLKIPDFFINGNPIRVIDERNNSKTI